MHILTNCRAILSRSPMTTVACDRSAFWTKYRCFVVRAWGTLHECMGLVLSQAATRSQESLVRVASGLRMLRSRQARTKSGRRMTLDLDVSLLHHSLRLLISLHSFLSLFDTTSHHQLRSPCHQYTYPPQCPLRTWYVHSLLLASRSVILIIRTLALYVRQVTKTLPRIMRLSPS